MLGGINMMTDMVLELIIYLQELPMEQKNNIVIVLMIIYLIAVVLSFIYISRIKD